MAPQTKSARHPESQSASQNCQDHTFPVTLIPDRSSGTEVLARRLIGTCAQMETIIIGYHVEGDLGREMSMAAKADVWQSRGEGQNQKGQNKQKVGGSGSLGQGQNLKGNKKRTGRYIKKV